MSTISTAQYRRTAALLWTWLDAHHLPVGDDPPWWAGNMARLCEGHPHTSACSGRSPSR
ncbi:hypothetical protein ACFY0G_39065 [Streptomyces sp. NPDC001552]|uniref:hypothetical protein n=1 Tax=Streptomyces sp. NPDC001552 TaxID=3364587 RepID=UPI00367A6FB2